MLIFGLIDKMAGFNHAKIWKSFQDILVKKEDVNTFAVNKLDIEKKTVWWKSNKIPFY